MQVVVGHVGRLRRIQSLFFGRTEQIQRRIEQLADRLFQEFCREKKG